MDDINLPPSTHFHEVLSDAAPAAWEGVLDQLVFRGLPIFNEVVFFHRPSHSLIVTDLVFHIHEAQSLLAAVILRLDGMWKRFGPSLALRLMLRMNRQAAREDIQRILLWDFERIVMSHGRILESGGRAALRTAFRFLG